MTIDLDAIQARYQAALDAKPSTHQNILDAGLRAGRIQGLRQAAEYADASINWDGETSPRRLTRDSLGQWLRDRATDLETGAE